MTKIVLTLYLRNKITELRYIRHFVESSFVPIKGSLIGKKFHMNFYLRITNKTTSSN